MRVLLVNPVPDRFFKSATCPLGLLSIATYLNEHSHTVKIVDEAAKRQYVHQLRQFKPDIVGISVISSKAIKQAVSFSKATRSRNIPVVWGGALASVIPDVILKNDFVDFVIIGEGEITWAELLETMGKNASLSGVDGLAYKINGETAVNKDRAFADLTGFPVIDWSLTDPSAYFQSLLAAKRMLYLYSAKGCPEECTFCFNKGFNRCTYRKRPFEYCMKEILYLSANTSLDGVHFADELWCRNRKEMVANCDKISNAQLNIVWGCNARIGTYEKEDFEYMFKAGCRWIFFGVESGSPRIQKEIKKRIPLDKVAQTVEYCTQSHIAAITSFIIGFPDETPEDIKETIALVREIPSALYDFNFYFPIPGSEMCEKLIAEGRYKPPKTLAEYAKMLPTEKLQMNFSRIPTKELKVIRAYFMWSSFSRKETASVSKRYSLTKKAISDAVKGLFGHGFKSFLIRLTFGVGTFLDIIFSLLLHPRIRAKYGLTQSNRQYQAGR